MRRRLLNPLTAVSLLLCVAVVVLWVRGRGGLFVCTTANRLWWVEPGDSGLGVTTVAGWPGPERPRWLPRGMKGSNDHTPVVSINETPPWTERRRFGVHWRQALVDTWLDERGAPVSLSAYLATDLAKGPGCRSAPLPCTQFGIPYWMVLALFALLPLSHATLTVHRALRRRRLTSRRCCPDCGYDLRESPDRCPECGAGASG